MFLLFCFLLPPPFDKVDLIDWISLCVMLSSISLKSIHCVASNFDVTDVAAALVMSGKPRVCYCCCKAKIN